MWQSNPWKLVCQTTHTHTHTDTHSHTHTHTHTRDRVKERDTICIVCFKFFYIFFWPTHNFLFFLSIRRSLTTTLFLSLTLSNTHVLSLTHIHYLSLALSHIHTLSLSHTHTHTLSLSHSIVVFSLLMPSSSRHQHLSLSFLHSLISWERNIFRSLLIQICRWSVIQHNLLLFPNQSEVNLEFRCK